MVELHQSSFQLVMDLVRVSYIQVEAATVKKDGYARFSWPHLEKDNAEGDGLLHIIDMEFWPLFPVQDFHFR